MTHCWTENKVCSVDLIRVQVLAPLFLNFINIKMDLKQLFHNPDDLDDSELWVCRTKIGNQMWMPYYSAIFLGLGMKVIDSTVFKRGT